jgi:hypothetical protein
LIRHGLLAGQHTEDASLGGCFVEHDVSDDVFAIHKHLQVLLTITSSSLSLRQVFSWSPIFWLWQGIFLSLLF